MIEASAEKDEAVEQEMEVGAAAVAAEEGGGGEE